VSVEEPRHLRTRVRHPHLFADETVSHTGRDLVSDTVINVLYTLVTLTVVQGLLEPRHFRTRIRHPHLFADETVSDQCVQHVASVYST